MGFIAARNLEKKYGNGGSSVFALSDISFDIHLGEFIGIVGESGAGKSTLLSIIGAMNTPTAGIFSVDDIDVYTLTGEQQADFRREYLGFVFQSFHLLAYLTVLENVMLPLVPIKSPKKRKRAKAMATLEAVGLAEKAERLPGQISGGEKERVAIARAIANEPPVLLADEPTGNLDSKTSGEVMALMQRLNRQGTTIVMVTHSRDCAAYTQRLLSLADGHLVDAPDVILPESVSMR